MTETARSEHLGFLTVIDHECHGLIGGYLVLNPSGRPLEFHCTSPIKPNRTQEILYGDTLKPYLFGEQIARMLLARAKTETKYVLTDMAAVLPVQELIDKPVVYVFGGLKFDRPTDPAEILLRLRSGESAHEDVEPPIEISEELNASLKSFGIENRRLQTSSPDEREPLRIPPVAGLGTERWKEFRIGNRSVALPGSEESERNRLLDDIRNTARVIDLIEPFTRIRLAIEETQRAA